MASNLFQAAIAVVEAEGDQARSTAVVEEVEVVLEVMASSEVVVGEDIEPEAKEASIVAEEGAVARTEVMAKDLAWVVELEGLEISRGRALSVYLSVGLCDWPRLSKAMSSPSPHCVEPRCQRQWY